MPKGVFLDPNQMQRVHCFAHRGEAYFILNNSQFKKMRHSFLELYQAGSTWVLITGEGLHAAMINLTATLQLISIPTLEVINWGIAGGLNRGFSLQNGYWIDRVICENPMGSFDFSSYELNSLSRNSSKIPIKCVSSFQRVLNSERAERLTPIADLVDRELYALAQVCSLFQVPLSAYKVISDKPSTSESMNICEFVNENKKDLAQKIFLEFERLETGLVHSESNLKKNEEKLNQSLFLQEIQKNEKFYFSETQRHQLQSLLHKLFRINSNGFIDKLKNQIIDLQTIKNIRPKDRSRKLIEFLRFALNPQNKEIADKLSTEIRNAESLFQKDLVESFDFESGSLVLRLESADSNSLKEKLNRLQDYNWDPIFEISVGKW